MSEKPIRVAILGSTRGSSLQPVIEAVEAGRLKASIVAVISNKKKSGILDRARDHGLPAFFISAKNKEREAFDRPVSVGDCAQVSRALEAWLDEDPSVPDRYVLEVSSPGIERPLVRKRDYERFRGQRVAVTRRKGLGELGKLGRRVEGELLGLEGADAIRLRLSGGDEVRISLDEVEGARLVHEWKR